MISQQICSTYLELAHSAAACGDVELARTMFAAAEREAAALGSQRCDLSKKVRELGELYVSQGRYKEAESLHKRALSTNQQLLGKDHVDLVPILDELTELYLLQNKELHAEPMAKRALSILEITYGAGPHLAERMFRLAGMWRRQGRLDEAQVLFGRAGRLSGHSTIM